VSADRLLGKGNDDQFAHENIENVYFESAQEIDDEDYLDPIEVITPFQEKHIFENLSVTAHDTSKQLTFYGMLNQGNKRGR
jgi:hypothetical protein